TTSDPINGALYGFATAMAMAETVEHYDVETPVTLKWPNDVLVGGAKISGILIEREAEALIVGTGLNLVSHPADTPYAATHLLAEMTPEALNDPEPRFTGAGAAAALLVSNILKWFEIFEQSGFGPLREAWLSRAHHLGKTVAVNEQTGTFLDLAMDGALCLTLPDGTKTLVHAGDVSFG
ncbi:MAG: biotin--[acetyl-CoA-carboxylase] ligase, partial [Pseudomonadota bacterium]